ncbi:MAG: DUF1294 domain-containing protein [Anaerolineales bacterium]|nr:DUF1294 domain-containing protein [Anaerolineales bacterium]
MAKSSAVHRSSSPYWTFSLVAVAIVLVIALPLVFWLGLWWLWAYLIAINVATFALYGYDKAVAGGEQTRVPERVLHLAELLGGTPAAFVGQRVFHHKTQKSSFQVKFWLIVVVQVLAVLAIWWFGRG